MTRFSPPSPPLSVPLSQQDHTHGDLSAKLILVEYGDYECPHCRRAQAVVQAIEEQFGDRLLFGFRHFPLAKIHPHALLAAQAAEAAGAQGKFWEMHAMLFKNQSNLELGNLVEYAQEIGIDENRFLTEVESDVHLSHVQRDLSTGVRSGVNGTPTFFVQNHRFNQGYDLPALLEALNAVQ